MSGKQTEIEMTGEGVAAVKIEEIEIAANNYVDVRDRRMELTKQEVTAKTHLLQTLLEHSDELGTDANGNKCYHYDELVVILKSGKPNVKVRSEHSVEVEDEDEGESD